MRATHHVLPAVPSGGAQCRGFSTKRTEKALIQLPQSGNDNPHVVCQSTITPSLFAIINRMEGANEVGCVCSRYPRAGRKQLGIYLESL